MIGFAPRTGAAVQKQSGNTIRDAALLDIEFMRLIHCNAVCPKWIDFRIQFRHGRTSKD
jgi:hypothetical protein